MYTSTDGPRATPHSSIDPLPSDEEVEAFQRDGYYVTPHPVLSDDLIDRARYGVARYYEGERDWRLPITGGYLDWRPEHGGLLRINDYVSLQNEQLRELCGNPTIAAIAGHLTRSSEIRLFHDQLITKLPSSDASTVVGWHVDQAYWRTCTSERMLTAWIPLVEVNKEMGGLAVIRGSHLQGTQDWMTTFNDRDLPALEARLAAAGVQMRIAELNVPLGCVSFHLGKTIHGSKPNHGTTPRIALTVHYQDGDNRYRAQSDEHGRPALHVNDLLCRRAPDGNPDYSDPEICPTLWRAEAQ
ncbi:phytanoyl-CoA dioxygenase family protein [Mesorhizobium sp. B1-1-1]|uniref:phytanoyl-CoA dioxygenase family protein n=1 Tax=Mesorhizobium sp. B1-1-1 TaxID=2589983 RepID=UPI00112813B7|nr:phytanoyl-CoA dioxygenase family protein [Mesorhizobium sp. B1-1-1]TPN63598.1 phytanoyl-CoA dioxygenase family protein [Mesorhizobium sp. B1-1-1]